MCRRTAINSFRTRPEVGNRQPRAGIEKARRVRLRGETPVPPLGRLASSDVEPVAEATHGHYARRLTRLHLDLSPQPVHVRLNNMAIVPVVAPDVIQEMVCAERGPRPLCKGPKQAELRWANLDSPAIY